MKKVKNISIIIIVVTSVLFLFGIKNYAVNENSNVTDNTLNQSTNSNTNTESTNTPSTNTRNYKFYSYTKYY